VALAASGFRVGAPALGERRIRQLGPAALLPPATLERKNHKMIETQRRLAPGIHDDHGLTLWHE